MNEKIKIYLTDRIQCTPDWSWQSSLSNWKGYHIWLVEGGASHITVGDKEYDLLPGDLFLFDLKEDHHCTHNPENPLKVYTIYFGCEELTLQTRAIFQNALLSQTVRQILDCVENHHTSQACLWLLALLSSFTQAPTEKKSLSQAVAAARTYLVHHLMQNVSLDELSHHTGYSKNQLIRLFQKEEGCTPMQFFLQKKIAYAKTQLLYSNRSVESISEELGFYDASYFSKVFKSQTGCSPREYRKQIQP